MEIGFRSMLLERRGSFLFYLIKGDRIRGGDFDEGPLKCNLASSLCL